MPSPERLSVTVTFERMIFRILKVLFWSQLLSSWLGHILTFLTSKSNPFIVNLVKFPQAVSEISFSQTFCNLYGHALKRAARRRNAFLQRLDAPSAWWYIWWTQRSVCLRRRSRRSSESRRKSCDRTPTCYNSGPFWRLRATSTPVRSSKIRTYWARWLTPHVRAQKSIWTSWPRTTLAAPRTSAMYISLLSSVFTIIIIIMFHVHIRDMALSTHSFRRNLKTLLFSFY